MRTTSALALLIGITLAGSSLVPAATCAATQVQPAAAVTAAGKVSGGRIKVVLSGDRLGQSALVSVRGLEGPAKGIKTTVTVKKIKTVKRLPAGRYRVAGKRIASAGRTAAAAPVLVKITTRRGATARLVYQAAPPPVNPGTKNRPPAFPEPLMYTWDVLVLSDGLRPVELSHTIIVHSPATDPDGDPLTYAWTSTIGPIRTLDPDGLVADWHTPVLFGRNILQSDATIKADDGRGGSDTYTFSIPPNAILE